MYFPFLEKPFATLNEISFFSILKALFNELRLFLRDAAAI